MPSYQEFSASTFTLSLSSILRLVESEVGDMCAFVAAPLKMGPCMRDIHNSPSRQCRPGHPPEALSRENHPAGILHFQCAAISVKFSISLPSFAASQGYFNRRTIRSIGYFGHKYRGTWCFSMDHAGHRPSPQLDIFGQ
jgi:hypothetical protein